MVLGRSLAFGCVERCPLVRLAWLPRTPGSHIGPEAAGSELRVEVVSDTTQRRILPVSKPASPLSSLCVDASVGVFPVAWRPAREESQGIGR